PKEIKAELAKVKSDLDSQQWFQEVRSAWSKLTALERDVVVFTRQEDRLNMSKHQLEQSLETLRRIEENNRVYIQGEDPELDRLIAEGDVTIQDEEWDEMSTGEKTEIALEVDKIMAETMENNVTKIQKLELKSVKGLSPLPDLAEKVQTPETTAEKSLLVRVKNDCNRITERANKEFEECVQDKQLDAACLCRLEAVKQVESIVTNASGRFSPGFFRDYLAALETCQNETLLVLSRPYLQALSQCVKDLESKDPDWSTIAESLEGLLRIKPPLPDSEVETQLEIIRSHFEYLLKQNDRDALVTQARLKTILDEMDQYIKEQLAVRHYNRSVRLLEEKQYQDAFKEIQAALEPFPENEKFLCQKKLIGDAAVYEEANIYFNESSKFFEKKQYSKALAEINKALDMCPEDGGFWEQKEKIEKFLPKAGERKVLTVDGVEFAFRWCPAGEFTMGEPNMLWPNDSSYKSFDRPEHKVRLTEGFWLLETEVTQKMWQCVMGAGVNPSEFRGDQKPVENVSWTKCQLYCSNLSKKLNRTVKLPTEAQWEYACLAGAKNVPRNDIRSFAWYDSNSDEETQAVGMKKPNDWGLYDMYGNVNEWCSDWYDQYYYTGSLKIDPESTTESSDGHVCRGGCWKFSDALCNPKIRFHYGRDWSFDWVGFRVLMVPGSGE
ncbi:MAG: SUMF1/EgtB/PvdO family nonheme iron enzyme, partial [Thermoguttaceae bacterium]